MGHPMNDLPPDPGQRAAEIVDLFARGGDGRANGVHRVMSLVTRNDKGGVINTLANLLAIMGNDPPLDGLFGFNEFTAQHLLMRSPPLIEDGSLALPGPYPRPWSAADVSLIQAYIQRVWIGKATRQDVENSMVACAEHRRFHPVKDWLASLKWDRKPRIDRWLHVAFGTADDDYHAAVGSKFLIAAVRRIRHPGVKFDHMPVLEGDQGIGKSTAIKILFGEQWFSDAIPDELASKDAAMALLGIWVLEFAEIQHLIRNEVEVIKAFLSRSTDRYRPPYGRTYIERPRQGVLIGSTNSTDYLRDTSGNRRIWPVKCEGADQDWIRENRDQLWAEAAFRESAGETIWLDDHNVVKQASAQQSDRMTEDVWTDAIREWLSMRLQVRIPEILNQVLQIPRERQGKREEMRIAAILTAEGWGRRLLRQTAGGRPQRVWEKAGGT